MSSACDSCWWLPIYPHYSEHPLTPWCIGQGTREKQGQKTGFAYKVPLKKRSAGGPASCGVSACHPRDKRRLLSGFYLRPRSHFLYKLNLYSSPSHSYFPVAHTRAASEKPCTAITHNFLATFTHHGAINPSGYVINFLHCLVSDVLQCVPWLMIVGP